MDRISKVAVFVEVVKSASFSGAGRVLGITGPAVSKQIKALENQLGVKLLNRTTRHVSLTEEGAIYFDRARKALEDLNEAEQQIQELKECPTGKLKINAPSSFGKLFLTKPIAKFAKQYPHVELDVDFDDRWVDVVAEGYDVVIRIGVLEDSSLIARKLASCPIVLCAAPSLLESHGEPNEPSELAEYPAVVYSRHGQFEEWRYRGQRGEIGQQKLNRVFAGNSAEIQLEACVQGVGVALLPVFSVASCLASGDLVNVLPSYQTYPERGIYVMFPQNRHLSTRVRLFVDWLTESAKSYPW